MQEIKIVYIDDQIDEILSKYISQGYCDTSFATTQRQVIKKVYEEVKFDGEQGYESLLNDTKIRSANVILIDNHLFEEHTADAGKFSGKQFKVILRKIFPFVVVLIITQDEALIGDNIIHKFSGRHGEDPESYYKKYLDHILDTAIKEVLEFEDLACDLKKSTDVEKLLVDKILQSLQGDRSYDALSRDDVDALISAFRELKNNCE